MSDPHLAADDIIAGLGTSRTRNVTHSTVGGHHDNLSSSGHKDAVTILRSGWSSEVMAPVLLPYLENEIATVQEMIRELASTIEETSQSLLESEDGSDDPSAKITLLIVETEMERLKFICRSYIRARLSKIDRDLLYYRLSEDQSLLSHHEQVYVDRHLTLLHKLYYSSFLSSWPEKAQDLAELEDELIKDVQVVPMVDEPDYDRPVAIRVLKDVPGPLEIRPDTLMLREGEVYVLRFSAVAHLLMGTSEQPYVELV